MLVLPLAWWSLTWGTVFATWCFLDFVNLAFHEAGHLFLGFGPSTLMFLGGTLGQLAVPLLLVFHFLLRRRDPLAAALCTWWFGQNFINISIYMADARALALPLVGGGDHDWNELFFRFGLLGEPSVQRVSTATHALGVFVMLLGLSWAVFFVLPPHKRERARMWLTVRWPWVEAVLER